jgi:hypothetical protein
VGSDFRSMNANPNNKSRFNHLWVGVVILERIYREALVGFGNFGTALQGGLRAQAPKA